AGPVVPDLTALAVQQLWCAIDLRAVRDGDGLVPQTHAEDGQVLAACSDHVDAHTGVLRPARTGRQQNTGKSRSERLGRLDLVIAAHRHVSTELREVM